MKFELKVERHYPHTAAEVWDGLTTNEGISDWLMESSNFKPEAGHRFEMSCVDDAGKLDVYRCEVLELDPPHRMLWSWMLAGGEAASRSEIEFRLGSTDTGTTVTLIHRGDLNQATIDRFKSGWQPRLDQLAETLNRRNETRQARKNSPV